MSPEQWEIAKEIVGSILFVLSLIALLVLGLCL